MTDPRRRFTKLLASFAVEHCKPEVVEVDDAFPTGNIHGLRDFTMSTSETPRRHLFEHGRLSYIQIPATNVRASGDFYANVFGWEVGGGDNKHLSFSDATRGMIGAWVTERAASQEPGVLPYIYVHGIDVVLERIKSRGAEIVKPPYAEGDLWVATFRDPGGNVIGIWQQGQR